MTDLLSFIVPPVKLELHEDEAAPIFGPLFYVSLKFCKSFLIVPGARRAACNHLVGR